MTLRLEHVPGSAVTVFAGEALLLRYVYAPTTPANESPRPYAHPVNTLAGDTLTNFRPNDHPWHHALSFTLNQVSGANFWGGPTCRRDEGYKWRDDHGSQHHVAWTALEATGATAARPPTSRLMRSLNSWSWISNSDRSDFFIKSTTCLILFRSKVLSSVRGWTSLIQPPEGVNQPSFQKGGGHFT